VLRVIDLMACLNRQWGSPYVSTIGITISMISRVMHATPDTFTRCQCMNSKCSWHEGGDGEVACPIRSRARASGARSRKRGPRTGGVEASKWPIPHLDHHPPKHPRVTYITKKKANWHTATEAQSGEHYQSWRRRMSNSPTPSGQSDNGSSSST